MRAMNTTIIEEDSQDVTAIVTAMTNDEKPFLLETVEAVLSDPHIGQVVLCIEEKNNWIETIFGSLIKDIRLDIVRIPMMPIGAVRNKALAYVKKNWIAYCDGDDVWCKGKILAQRKYARETGADFVGAGHYLVDENGTIRACGFSLFIPMPSSWLVKTEIMRRYPFNEKLMKGSDGDWWANKFNSIKKVKCPEILVRYRVRSYSVSSMALSKKRKLKVVYLACKPVIGMTILFFTYCVWLYTRHQKYRWLPDWSKWLNQKNTPAIS